MTDDKHAIGGFFIPGFLKLLRFQAHHKHILGRALPKLKGHMSAGIYTPTWFMHCFINQTPPLSADPEALGCLHPGGWALAHGHGLHRPQGAQEDVGLNVEHRPRRRECQPHEGSQGALW